MSLSLPPLLRSRFVSLSTHNLSLSQNIPLSNCLFLESLWKQGMFRGSYQTDPYMLHKEPSKGTGVFIPKSSQSRRRPHHPKQGRVNSFNTKQHNPLHQNRQQYQDNSRCTLTTHNNNKSSMNTNNVHASIPKRTYRDATSIYTWLIFNKYSALFMVFVWLIHIIIYRCISFIYL